ncbi:MAG: DUF6263 family protein [Bacteroidota bacterium]
MKYSHKIFSLIALLLPHILISQVQLGYTLQLKDTFLIKQTANQELTMKLEGSEQIITNVLEGLFALEVDSLLGDTYLIKITYRDFALKSSASQQGVLMDVRASEIKEGDLMSSIFNGLLNEQMQIQLKKDGSIVAVAGAESIIDKMISAMGGLDEFTTSLIKKSLEKEFSSEVLAKSFEQMTYVYGNQPVSIGDTWRTNFSGKITADNLWTLEKVTDDVVAISGTADILMNTEEDSLEMKLSGTQETLLEASKKNGVLLKMMISGSGEGTSTMATAANVTIPTTLKQTLTYELITE